MPKNISIYLSDRLLQIISEAISQLGHGSRSDFFRTSARFYLKNEGFNMNCVDANHKTEGRRVFSRRRSKQG